MDYSNELRVAFGPLKTKTTQEIYRLDEEQYLVFTDIELPEYFRTDFGLTENSDTVAMTGQDGKVLIPDELLLRPGLIHAWVWANTGTYGGRTIYHVRIPVKVRGNRDDIDPVPAAQQQIDSLLDALNDGVDRAEEAAEFLENASAEAETLEPGSEATAHYESGVFHFGIPQGLKGDTGNGIASIELYETSGLNKTYRITMTDGAHFDFTVHDGKGISSIVKTSTSGLTDTYTISFTDGDSTTFTVTNGKGITSCELNADYTLTINYNDGTSTTTTSIRGVGISSFHEYGSGTESDGRPYIDYVFEFDDESEEVIRVHDGKQGDAYVLTEADKQEIAGIAIEDEDVFQDDTGQSIKDLVELIEDYTHTIADITGEDTGVFQETTGLAIEDILEDIRTAVQTIAAFTEYTGDTELSDTSEMWVQNKVVKAALDTITQSVSTLDSDIKAGTQATAVYHLGFYLDGNGDLCQVED